MKSDFNPIRSVPARTPLLKFSRAGFFISPPSATIPVMEMVLKSLKDTQKLAQKLAKEILLKGSPSVMAFYGDLGAGKTTFVQFFARALGVKEKILSPTFLIVKVFELTKVKNFKTLTHIDTYRLKSAKDLLALGLKEILKNKENITVIEWPEKIEKYLPKGAVKIYFKIKNAKERIATIK